MPDLRPVLAVDPSLTSCGFAYRAEGNIRTGTIRTKNDRPMLERIDFILKHLGDIIDRSSPGILAIEGYAFSFGRTNSQYMQTAGEVSGSIKYMCWANNMGILVVPPSTLKRFSTGRGNASKDQMRGWVLSKWGYDIKQPDEVDAFCLMHYGEAFCDLRKRNTYDEDRRDSISKSEFTPP